MDRDVHTPFYLDKSLWLAFLGFLLPIVNRKFNLGLQAEEVAAALLPVATFIGSSKWKQVRVVEAKVEAAKVATAEAAAITDGQKAADALKGIGEPK